jgi:hypothetical protein
MNMSYLISLASRLTLCILRRPSICAFLVFSAVFRATAVSKGQKLSRVVRDVTLYINGK